MKYNYQLRKKILGFWCLISFNLGCTTYAEFSDYRVEKETEKINFYSTNEGGICEVKLQNGSIVQGIPGIVTLQTNSEERQSNQENNLWSTYLSDGMMGSRTSISVYEGRVVSDLDYFAQAYNTSTQEFLLPFMKCENFKNFMNTQYRESGITGKTNKVDFVNALMATHPLIATLIDQEQSFISQLDQHPSDWSMIMVTCIKSDPVFGSPSPNKKCFETSNEYTLYFGSESYSSVYQVTIGKRSTLVSALSGGLFLYLVMQLTVL